MGIAKRLDNTTTLYMRKREFGFICAMFSLGMSGDGFLLPRSGKQLLKRTLLAADVAVRDLTGRYTLLVHHDGVEVCSIPVVVAWATHKGLPRDAFLAIKAKEPQELRRNLRALAGKNVSLEFRPRLAPHVQRPVNLRHPG